MRLNRLKTFLRHGLLSWAKSLLISLVLASLIFGGIFVFALSSYEEVGIEGSPLDDIVYSLNLISPQQLGVAEWQIGDYVTYRYSRKLITPTHVPEQHWDTEAIKTYLAPRDVKFHIVGELSPYEQKRYWMQTTGLLYFRTIPKDIYQLVSPADLRITPETPRFHFVKNYVPSRADLYRQTSMPKATLVKIDEVSLETAAGRFECIQYRVEFGPNSTPIEIWANPKVLPLGIVRVRTPKEVFELTAYGKDTEFNIPELIQPVIEGISTLKEGCTSCHGYSDCHEFIFPPR